MEVREYITEEEFKRLLDYFKMNKLWKYYIIVYNLSLGGKTYDDLKKGGLDKIIIPEGIPIPKDNPFDLTIRTINKQIKIYQAKCGIRGVNISTKIFRKKFFMGGKVYFGLYEKEKGSYKRVEGVRYLYVIRHSHRDKNIDSLFTDKKIGISFDYGRRIKTLTLGPVGVEIISVWKMSRKMAELVEKEIHKILSDRRLVGEWFSDEDGQLLDIVRKLVFQYSPTLVE